MRRTLACFTVYKECESLFGSKTMCMETRKYIKCGHMRCNSIAISIKFLPLILQGKYLFQGTPEAFSEHMLPVIEEQ